jgi:hypothetical protein
VEEGKFAAGGKAILLGQKSCAKKKGQKSCAKELGQKSCAEKAGLKKLHEKARSYRPSLLACNKFLN